MSSSPRAASPRSRRVEKLYGLKEKVQRALAEQQQAGQGDPYAAPARTHHARAPAPEPAPRSQHGRAGPVTALRSSDLDNGDETPSPRSTGERNMRVQSVKNRLEAMSQSAGKPQAFLQMDHYAKGGSGSGGGANAVAAVSKENRRLFGRSASSDLGSDLGSDVVAASEKSPRQPVALSRSAAAASSDVRARREIIESRAAAAASEERRVGERERAAEDARRRAEAEEAERLAAAERSARWAARTSTFERGASVGPGPGPGAGAGSSRGGASPLRRRQAAASAAGPPGGPPGGSAPPPPPPRAAASGGPPSGAGPAPARRAPNAPTTSSDSSAASKGFPRGGASPASVGLAVGGSGRRSPPADAVAMAVNRMSRPGSAMGRVEGHAQLPAFAQQAAHAHAYAQDDSGEEILMAASPRAAPASAKSSSPRAFRAPQVQPQAPSQASRELSREPLREPSVSRMEPAGVTRAKLEAAEAAAAGAEQVAADLARRLEDALGREDQLVRRLQVTRTERYYFCGGGGDDDDYYCYYYYYADGMLTSGHGDMKII